MAVAPSEGQARPARRRRLSTAALRATSGGGGGGGLVDMTGELLPGVFELLDTRSFASLGQTQRALSNAAHQWEERELLRLDREIDAFMAAVRSTDRLVAVIQYDAPFLLYFDFDDHRGRGWRGLAAEEKDVERIGGGGGAGGPVGNPVVLANNASLHRKQFMEKVKRVIRVQADGVQFGYRAGRAVPTRIVLLRSKQTNVMEQDLLTKLLPLYPVFATTEYYSSDFVLDDHKVDQLVTNVNFEDGRHHLAYMEVDDFLEEFNSNVWHNKHRYGRSLVGSDLFFTPVLSDDIERYFPGNRSLVLRGPVGPEAVTRWSNSHPVYGAR